MIHVLKLDHRASIRIPSEEKFAKFKTAINTKYPILEDVWATMDGLKLYLQKSPHQSIQEMFYNGWKADHYVTNVFVFVPDGTIPIAFFNVPGCVHDSQVADWGGIYDKLESVYKSNGGVCVVDSAFGNIT